MVHSEGCTTGTVCGGHGRCPAITYVKPKRQKKHPCMWRQNPCSLIGREVSQLEAPGWLARSMALDRAGGISSCRVEAVWAELSLLSCWMSLFAFKAEVTYLIVSQALPRHYLKPCGKYLFWVKGHSDASRQLLKTLVYL